MKLMLYNSSGPKKAIYKNIGYWETEGKIKRNIKLLGLGNINLLKEKNENYESIIKRIIKKYDDKVDLVFLKTEIEKALQKQATYWDVLNAGSEFIKEYIEDINLLNQIDFGKHKGMKEIISFQIANKIADPKSIIQQFYKKNTTTLDVDYSKNSFYRMLDLLLKNKSKILNFIFESRINKENNLMFFDSTTVYFESFTKEGLKHPGYSKDGKFKEDQIVLAMACDNEGIPIFYKLFPGNTADVNTLIPFFAELKEKFTINKIIVVADRGMSSAQNIKFLEANNIDFIISYRAKVSSKKYKEYLLNQSDYIKISDSFKYKEREMISVYENIAYKRKQIITVSETRAKMDRLNRKNDINNFLKNQNKEGYVSEKKLIGSKKTKYFKQLNASKYVLDEEKIQYDEQFDGIYVYETSLVETEALKIVDFYSNQWKIEENFRTLKNNIEIRPMFVYTQEHIEGYVLFSFISLYILKTLINKIRNFYKENGVIEKITDQSLINVLNNLEYIVEKDSNTDEILLKTKKEGEFSNYAWKIYEEFKKYIKVNK
ncbi:IS1634 family transposase [Mycoplasma sp. AC157]